MSKSSYSHLSDMDNPYRTDIETRKAVNLDYKIGNIRMVSSVLAENGMTPEEIVRLSWHEFRVTFHTEYPYGQKYHGRDILFMGILNSSQVQSIMSYVPEMTYGVSPFSIATMADGVRITIEVVKLPRGKRQETLSADGTKLIKPKAYKRNRRSNW